MYRWLVESQRERACFPAGFQDLQEITLRHFVSPKLLWKQRDQSLKRVKPSRRRYFPSFIPSPTYPWKTSRGRNCILGKTRYDFQQVQYAPRTSKRRSKASPPRRVWLCALGVINICHGWQAVSLISRNVDGCYWTVFPLDEQNFAGISRKERNPRSTSVE